MELNKKQKTVLLMHYDITGRLTFHLMDIKNVITSSIAADIIKFPPGVPEILHSQGWDWLVVIRPWKSNQFIVESNWKFITDLKKRKKKKEKSYVIFVRYPNLSNEAEGQLENILSGKSLFPAHWLWQKHEDSKNSFFPCALVPVIPQT